MKYNIGKEGVIHGGDNIRKVTELGLRQYKLNLEMFIDLAKNIHALPILVTQARLVSEKNTEKEKSMIGYHYQKMNHQTLVGAFEDTDKIILSVAQSKGIPALDVSKKMTGKGEYFSDAVHLTKSGSNQLAIHISNFLFKEIRKSIEES